MWQPVTSHRHGVATTPAAAAGFEKKVNAPAAEKASGADQVQFSGRAKGPTQMELMEAQLSQVTQQRDLLMRELARVKLLRAQDMMDRLYGDEPGLQIRGEEIVDEMLQYERNKITERKSQVKSYLMQAEDEATKARKNLHWYQNTKLSFKQKRDLKKEGFTLATLQQEANRTTQALNELNQLVKELDSPDTRYPFTKEEVQARFVQARQKAALVALHALDEASVFTHPAGSPDKYVLSKFALEARRTLRETAPVPTPVPAVEEDDGDDDDVNDFNAWLSGGQSAEGSGSSPAGPENWS